MVWYKDNYEAVLSGDGHHQHLEVQSHITVVKRAIENPDQINKGNRGWYYYAWFAGDRNYPNAHMKVVIRRTLLGYGRLKIVTAYFTSSFGSSEETIWTKT